MALLEWYYVLAVIVGFAFWLYSTVKTFHKQMNRKNTRIPDINVLRKVVPLHPSNGWRVKSVCNALPVWYYSTTFTFAPKNLVATRTILQGKSCRVLEELKSAKVFSMIFPEFPTFRRSESRDQVDGDELILSNLFSSLSLPSILLTGQQTVLTFERYWSHGGSRASWLYVTPTVQLLTSKYGYWFCFLLQDTEHDTCLLHILASYPDGVNLQTVNQRISSCQVLIKDHIESLVPEKSNPPSSLTDDDDSAKVKRLRSRTSSNPLQTSGHSSPGTPQSLNSSLEAIGLVEEPAVIQRTLQTDRERSKTRVSEAKPDNASPDNASPTPNREKISNNNSRHSLNKSENTNTKTDEDVQQKQSKEIDIQQKQTNKIQMKQKQAKETKNEKNCAVDKFPYVNNIKFPRLAPYVETINESFKTLLKIWEADENSAGWVLYNEKDDVVIHRKAATGEEGSFSADIYKGKTTIRVPLPYLINYIKDLQYRSEYDNMFESSDIIEDLGDELSHIVCLVFKNLFLVTGRDFCSISSQRRIKDNLYGIMNKGVTHPGCPEKRSKVRGEIIAGGYIFEEVSRDPPVVNVMYAVCTNMNGAIPQKIVNKVLSDQPLSLAIVRSKLEERYRKRNPNVDGEEHFAKFCSVPSVYPTEVLNDVTEVLNDVPEVLDDSPEVLNDDLNDEPVNSEIEEPIINEIEEEVQLETGPFTMVSETMVVANEESNLETEPSSGSNTSLENENKNGNIIQDKQDGSRGGVLYNSESLPSLLPSNIKKSTTITVADTHYTSQNLLDYVPSINTNSPTINSFTSETMLSSGFDLKENHYTLSDDNLELPQNMTNGNSDNDDTESLGGETGSQFSEDNNSGDNNSYYSFDHPRDSNGQIDYASLANQSTVGLEEEFFAARKVDTTIKHHDSMQLDDEWMYRGTTKDVVIMRKTSSKQKIHSFLGRGVINVLPVTVWEMIKTPTTRHVYDSMLKKISTVKQIDKKTRIVHMRHETHACFVKQARDFCVMTVEAIKQQRYVITGVSVDVPECPTMYDCVRGRVYYSGWIIEPIVQNGKSASLVTYISQVDFGGRLPTRLVNFISKRQPLAISYLRTYLEAAEN